MRKDKLTLAVVAVGTILLVVSVTVLALAIFLPVAVLHVTIAVLRAPRAVAPALVTPAVVVTLTPVLIIVATTARWGYGTAAATSTAWRTLTARWAAGIETPASRWWSACPLESCQFYVSICDDHFYSPRSSAGRRGQCACCASRSKHRRHPDGSRTQRRRTCGRVSKGARMSEGTLTYSLLEGVRGAGISQRTSRPYLGYR